MLTLFRISKQAAVVAIRLWAEGVRSPIEPQIEPDWELAAQPAADYEVYQHVNL
jgi:hypothetical protein